MKNGLLIYTKEDYEINKEFAQRFTVYGKNYGYNIEIILENDLLYGIKGGRFFFSIKNNENFLPDFVINRTRNGFISQVLENLGVRVFNSSLVTFICNDKNKTYLAALKAGIKCLDTYIYTKENLKNAEFPVVVKKPFSHGGRQVYLCNNNIELCDAIGKIDGRFITVQQKLRADIISDIRVFIMGNKVIGAVKRTAVSGIKANLCLGGKISLYDIDKKLQNYIDSLLKITYFDFAGFDFLTENGSEYYFNEIEDAVGSRSLCSLADIDTADEYLKHISKIIN